MQTAIGIKLLSGESECLEDMGGRKQEREQDAGFILGEGST